MARYDRPWSEEEIARLMRVYRQVKAVQSFGIWPIIAKQFPERTAHQCAGKFRYIASGPRGPAYLPTLGGRERIERDARKNIPAEVIADAHRRNFMSHQSLTAEFCGDPLPGRSALDQRDKSERPRITLAGPRL